MNTSPEQEQAPPAANTSYTPYLRQGFMALFLLVVVVGGWASWFKIKGAVIASGVIVVEGKPKTLRHCRRNFGAKRR